MPNAADGFIIQLFYSRRTSNSGPEEVWMPKRFLVGRKEGGDRRGIKEGGTLLG